MKALTDANTWNTSQPNFASALSTYITNAVSPLDTHKLYHYGQITPLVLCSNNSSAEHSAPSISTRLLDKPNAAKIAVQYAYTPTISI